MFEDNLKLKVLDRSYEVDHFTENIEFTFSVFFTYILPPICAFGICTNILNIIVFSSKKLKNEIFKYFKMKSYSNIMYLLFAFFIFSARCGNVNKNFVMKIIINNIF